MIMTGRQCQTWQDSGTLWAQAIHHGGDGSPDRHNNLGVWWAKKGDLDHAVAELKRAVWLRPDQCEAHVNRASALSQKDDLDGAIAALRVAA